MVEVEQLRKSYGDLTAVDGISFTARPGEIFGLLGPNGAGKTTTIGCICGLLVPTAGQGGPSSSDMAGGECPSACAVHGKRLQESLSNPMDTAITGAMPGR